MYATEVTFNREVAERIGVTEALLLHFLVQRCRSGRLIRKRAMNVKDLRERMFRRSDNYRLVHSGLIDGHRYVRIPYIMLRYKFPWVSVSSLRRAVRGLRRRGLIDVKNPDLIVNDGANCYSTYPNRIRRFKHRCYIHSMRKPNVKPHRLHRRYSFAESRLDPSMKPLKNDRGQIVGAISDFGKPRWLIK